MLLSTRHLEQPARAAVALVLAAVVLLPGHGQVRAHGTVVHDDAGAAAADIGLIGDSSLAGVRWFDAYGELDEFNYLFNAESCRRTIETSCWSREGYRPDNAITTMQQHRGEWGDVLVVMSGYNDSSYLVDDAVDEVVAEARRQGIPQVVWLTLRTSDVTYEEPLHQANGDTYGESNRMLFDAADEHGDVLQIADWATYSAQHPEWLTADGVHLTADGASELTSFIADQTSAVLDGETITPDHPPWTTLAEGDSGDTVMEAQEALIDEGVTSVGEVDGAYGDVTASAVEEFQRSAGVEPTGEIDIPTAVELGLYEEPTFGDPPAARDGADLPVVWERAERRAASHAGADGPQAGSGRGSAGASSDRGMANAAASIDPANRVGSWIVRDIVAIGTFAAIVAAAAIGMGPLRQWARSTAPRLRRASSGGEAPNDEPGEPLGPDDPTSPLEVTALDAPYDHEQEPVSASASSSTTSPWSTPARRPATQPSTPVRGVTNPDS